VIVHAYDFQRPEPLTDSQRAMIDSAFETFARQLATQITAKTRVVSDVSYSEFVLLPYGDLARDDGDGNGFVLSALDDVVPRVVYRLPLQEAHFWASRMVGGPARGSTERPSLTAIERALVWQMADEQLAELHLAFDGLLPTIRVEAFAYVLVDSFAPQEELMVCATFAVERDSGSTTLAVAVPAAPILAALGRGVSRRPQADIRTLLQEHVAAAPVEVALRFDETRVGPAIVLGLAEGDVIPLNHPRHRPLALTMDGSPVVRAAVGGNGGRLACVVVDS
jgi:flagellar motor switch protein FliM